MSRRIIVRVIRKRARRPPAEPDVRRIAHEAYVSGVKYGGQSVATALWQHFTKEQQDTTLARIVAALERIAMPRRKTVVRDAHGRIAGIQEEGLK